MLKTELKNKEIEFMREVTSEEFLALVSKMVKQRQDSSDQYENGGRKDLAQKEQDEIAVLKVYLPDPLSESELDDLIKQAIAETGAQDMKGMGQVMQVLRPQTAGRIDGKLIADKVKAALA